MRTPALQLLLPSGALEPTPGQARELLRQELSRAEYRPTVLERARDFVFDLVDRAQQAIADTGAFNLLTLTIFAAAVAVGLLWLLARLRPQTQARAAPTVLGQTRRTAAEHRAAARTALEHTRWDDAVIEAMRALARDLEQRPPVPSGSLRHLAPTDVRPGSTAREVAALARRRFPGHDDALDAAARSFEDVVYGDRRAGQADAERVVRLIEGLAARTPTDGRNGPVEAVPQ